MRFNEIGFSFFRPSFWHIERVDIFVFVVLVTQLTGFCDLYGNVSIGGKGVGETGTTARGDLPSRIEFDCWRAVNYEQICV